MKRNPLIGVMTLSAFVPINSLDQKPNVILIYGDDLGYGIWNVTEQKI